VIEFVKELFKLLSVRLLADNNLYDLILIRTSIKCLMIIVLIIDVMEDLERIIYWSMFKSFCIKEGESSPITNICPVEFVWVSQVIDPSIIRSSVIVTAEDLLEL
jgi:hypothetical protein